MSIRTPKEADHLGIATVYQDLALCDNLDIVQNMFLGHEALSHRLLDETRMELTAKKTLADLSVTTVSSVRQLVGSLSGGQRQSVAVARAVMRDARLVIMDEPTAALGVSQTGPGARPDQDPRASGGSRSSSSPTTSTTCSRWPTAWPSSTWAGWSAAGRSPTTTPNGPSS